MNQVNSSSHKSQTAARAIYELTHAFVATMITLLLAVVLYIFLPDMQAFLKDLNPGLLHTRSFATLPGGGNIEYSLGEQDHLSPEELKAVLHSYEEDLKILARRFQRGQFEMASLAGMKNSELVLKMKAFRDDYRYSVNGGADSVTLQIETSNPEATQALHTYLKYLEERWAFRQ